jgi:hypothetical protein
MTHTISANTVIDTICNELWEMREARRKIPRGSYITKTSPYYDDCKLMRRAEHTITAVSDVLGISEDALRRAARVARKWYERGDWARCLTEDTAARLLTCLIGQDD